MSETLQSKSPPLEAGDKQGTVLTTHNGFRFSVRPARTSDEKALGEFFEHVSADDLRFRFLSGIKKVGHERIVAMTAVDHRQTENYLAFVDDEAEIVASAMLACDAAMDVGEVAMATRSDAKGRGISWTLLAHVGREAKAKGLRVLQSIETRDHHEAIDMEREMGFVARPCPGDATLMLVEQVLNLS